MIRLDNIDRGAQHFVVRADEPVRIEVSVTPNGDIIAHVYKGTESDLEQEPEGAYDGSLPHADRTDWQTK